MYYLCIMLTISFPTFLDLSFIDILDILTIAVIIYLIFRWIRGTSAMNIFFAILVLLIIRIVAYALNMKMLSALMGTVIDVGAVALIVIFQPEIRRFLTRLGRSAVLKGNGGQRLLDKILGRKSSAMSNPSIDEIAKACKEMSNQMTGALIVLPHKDTLEEIIETGDVIDAQISKRLIMNIFFKNAPLHDGAMIINQDRIVAARCTLPVTERMDIPESYGMRHKAAIGLSEKSDADIIVVSEQTGNISFVRNGVPTLIQSINTLKLLLSDGEKSDKTGDKAGVRQDS